jgi:hypothetical protein
MQLLAAHQVLIAAAIGLFGLFCVRAAVLFARGGGATNAVLAVGSLVVSAALLLYFRRLRARWAELRAAARRRS